MPDKKKVHDVFVIEVDRNDPEKKYWRQVGVAAGLPLLRIRAAMSYDPNSLTEKIRNVINQKPTGVAIPTPFPIY